MVLQKCDLAATILFVRISGAEMQKKFKNDILLVAGVPGAGKSTALNALEDSGFQIIDRIPLNMIPSVNKQINLIMRYKRITRRTRKTR